MTCIACGDGRLSLDRRWLSTWSGQSIEIVYGTCSEVGTVTIEPIRHLQEDPPAMALINTEIKPFKATAFHNGEFVDVSDEDLKGTWSVVFFYPADFTFVCPTELGDLADNYAEFQRLGVEIYSVSTDTHFAHKAWHDASDTIKKIKYPMIADPPGHLTRAFGVHIEEACLAYRGTFLINPEGQ